MTEEFVKLETAKLLKEKGFREDCMAFYTKDGQVVDEHVIAWVKVEFGIKP